MVNVTIPAGESSANFTVTILDDAILEEEELLNLALSIPPYPASLGIHSSAYATVTITDDDFLTVQFAESSYSVSEGAGEVVLILTANGTSAVNYTVVVDTVDGSATGLPPFNASGLPLSIEGDYESNSYTVVFQPGDTTAELRIPILDDSLGVEGTEDFTAVLSLLFSIVSVTPGSTDVAAVLINDDDETFVEFTPVNYIVNERERVIVLNISSSDVGALNYSVEVDLLPGTAQSHDYSSQQYTAFFATGETSAQVAVAVFYDNVTEGGENFTAVLNISEYSQVLGVRLSRNGSTAIVYIEDNVCPAEGVTVRLPNSIVYANISLPTASPGLSPLPCPCHTIDSTALAYRRCLSDGTWLTSSVSEWVLTVDSSVCALDMTLQSFADIESNNNLADPEIRDIALNDLSAVYSASVSFMASTDNLTLAEMAAIVRNALDITIASINVSVGQELTVTRNSFTINILSINASAPTLEGLFQTYNRSSNSSISVDGCSPPTEMVSVYIPAGVFRTVAALSNSSSIHLSIVRIETSARFLYPDEVTRNFDTSVILSVSFEGVTLQNLSTSDEILITFEKAETASRIRCVFYDVARNGNLGGWSQVGGTIIDETGTTATCAFNHNTEYTLLQDLSTATASSPQQILLLALITVGVVVTVVVVTTIVICSAQAISKRRRVKKVFEVPPVEQVVTNISATKADWTLEEHELSAMQHIYEDPGPEHLEMTAL